MKLIPEHFDIIIIGAGPAGMTAAIRLLQMGHIVGLIEQEVFPRHQIGESLSPGIRNIFSYLDAAHLLEDKTYLNNLPARVIWENREPDFISTEQRGAGIVVNRSLLDQQLLELAVSKGLHVFQPAKLQSSAYNEGRWQLNIISDLPLKTIYSKVILDARGRKGSALHERIETAAPSVSVWTHIPSTSMPYETNIEAIEEGWIWGSPVGQNRYRIMAFIDPTLIRKKSLAATLEDLITESTLFASAAKRIDSHDIQTCSVTSFVHNNPWHQQYVKIGEAAFTLDPLSSTGVEKAMRFSMQTAIAINTMLKYNEADIAQSFYENKLIESAVKHAHWAASYYAAAWPAKEESHFWKNRVDFKLICQSLPNDFSKHFQKSFNEVHPIPEYHRNAEIPLGIILNHLGNKRIKLSPSIIFKEEYSVTDDRIEIKQAIHHPEFESPVIYLNEIEIIPLLNIIKEGIAYSDLIPKWNSLISLESAYKIIAFLWLRNLIVLEDYWHDSE